MVHISFERIEGHMKRISQIGNRGASPSEGFTRAAWPDEETAAMKDIEEQGRAAGFNARGNPIGNLFLCFPGRSDKAIQAGSQRDAVPVERNHMMVLLGS